MKKTVALALILTLGFQFASKLGILAVYHFYKDLVIENYCVNKQQPELHCEASCFLSKSLESQDDPAGREPAVKPIEFPVFLLSAACQLPILLTQDYFEGFPEPPAYLYLYTQERFHPPKV